MSQPPRDDSALPSKDDPVKRHRLQREDSRTAGSFYSMAGVGFEFAAAILLLGGVGWWFDKRLDTDPWLMVVGFGLGFVVGLWLLIKAAGRMFRG